MELQKLAVKLFTTDPGRPPLADFIEVFHRWIQQGEGNYHDVADYSHMQGGPGIVLVAYDANVSIDETDNRRGLLYSRKARLDGSNQEILRAVLTAALENCRRLEEEPLFGGVVRFSGNELLFSVNDRLGAPNNDECYEALKSEVAILAGLLYPCASLGFDRDPDPRKRLNLRLTAPTSRSAVELLQVLRPASEKDIFRGI
ncbi:MAG TPA: hypothetical protein VNN77_19615 [candidate division Zixibacteria bacterium]|nr:hypothetical protein [candidate division Zixibacteria bacterium]